MQNVKFVKSELLAPAKNKETAFAAIDSGADAVYMGAVAFGARQNASNSLEDIQEVVNYAHKFWAKVFITINTILDDKEVYEALSLIKKLYKMGVDAIIIQDMGLLKLIKDSELDIPIHISTQCDNKELQKIKFFNKIGIPRVVLARELSINKIKEIHDANPKLELEAFVHGALCVSYSGQCYLSYYMGGRSGNRGECAQPCRKKYSVITKNGKVIAENIYALCLKDLNASEHIEELLNAGIYSFKIEGRLKDIAYIKNVTAYYRKILDKFSSKSSSGKSFYKFEPNPEKTFNRGFTTYFLKDRESCYNFVSPKSQGEFIGSVKEVKNNMIVLKTQKQIHPQDGLMCNDSGFLVNKIENCKEKNLVKIYPNKKVNIHAGAKLYRNSDIEFNKLLEQPIKRKIGISVVINNGISVIDEDGVTVSTEFISNEQAINQEKMNTTFEKQFSKTGESDFYITDFQILSKIPFMTIGEINKLRRELFETLIQKRINTYKKELFSPIKYADYYKKEDDYHANVHNKKAQEFYNCCGCKITEPSLETKLPNRQIELMRTKHCIKYALNMCKQPIDLFLKEESGKIFPLKFNCKQCEMSILTSN